jgi:hypothetical protein
VNTNDLSQIHNHNHNVNAFSEDRRKNEFRQLWKMVYARESFRYVRKICDFITDQRLDRSSPVHYQLCTAIVVLYARPFKHSDIVGALSEKFVPNEMRSLHDQLMKLRDQVAAHFPANAMPYGSDGLPANSVWLIINDDGQRSLAVQGLHFSATAISDIIALSNVLSEGTHNEVTSIWTRLHEQRLLPTFPGEYVMDSEKAEFTPMNMPRD